MIIKIHQSISSSKLLNFIYEFLIHVFVSILLLNFYTVFIPAEFEMIVMFVSLVYFVNYLLRVIIMKLAPTLVFASFGLIFVCSSLLSYYICLGILNLDYVSGLHLIGYLVTLTIIKSILKNIIIKIKNRR